MQARDAAVLVHSWTRALASSSQCHMFFCAFRAGPRPRASGVSGHSRDCTRAAPLTPPAVAVCLALRAALPLSLSCSPSLASRWCWRRRGRATRRPSSWSCAATRCAFPPASPRAAARPRAIVETRVECAVLRESALCVPPSAHRHTVPRSARMTRPPHTWQCALAAVGGGHGAQRVGGGSPYVVTRCALLRRQRCACRERIAPFCGGGGARARDCTVLYRDLGKI